MLGGPLKKTLSEFVRLIQKFALAGYVQENYIAGENNPHLPFTVCCAFSKLDKRLHDPSWQAMLSPPKKFFDEFILELVAYALVNWQVANDETFQAEYLLGFLLHLNLHILFEEETNEENSEANKEILYVNSFEDLMFAQFPINIARYVRSGILYYTSRPVPAEGYDFLSPTWRARQNYPTIEFLNDFANKIEEQEQQKAALLRQEQEKKEQEEAALLRQQYHLALLNKYSYPYIITLEKFSIVLECFIKTGKVQFPKFAQFSHRATTLSAELSIKIVHFAEVARSNFATHEKKRTFLELIRVIIASAKTQHVGQEAAILLLGFLLYHPFQITDGEYIYGIRDIYSSQFNATERYLFQQRGVDPFFVSNPDWQKQQGFPDKEILEVIESRLRPSPNFLPLYKGQEVPVSFEAIPEGNPNYSVNRYPF